MKIRISWAVLRAMPEDRRSALAACPSGRRAVKRGRERRMAFAELCITSNFTFLTGGSHPQEYALRAIELGLPAFAIADRNSVAGLVRAHQELREAARGGRAVPRLIPGGPALPGRGRAGADRAAARPRRLGAALPGAVAGGAAGGEGGVPAACGGSGRPRRDAPPPAPSPRRQLAAWLPRARDSPGAIPGRIWWRAPATTGRTGRGSTRAARLAGELGLRLVASAEPIMHHGSRRRLVDVLTCIREGRRIDTIGRAAQANAERRLRPEAEMLRLFAGHEAAVHRAGEIAAECRFALDSLRYEYPREILGRRGPAGAAGAADREGAGLALSARGAGEGGGAGGARAGADRAARTMRPTS